MPDDIKAILFTLKVADNQVLFIVLSEDGSINRMGDGSPNCKDNNLYIGITKDKLFEQLKPYITEEVKEFFGKVYDIPEKEGRLCDFQIMVKGDTTETGVQFLYGELSEGVPTPFRTLAIKAIELTDKWHMQQKQMSSTKTNVTDTTKPWWKFW